jgi:lysophospholipase L1-like esterase
MNDKILLIGGNCRIQNYAIKQEFKYVTDWVDHIAPGNNWPEFWGEIKMINGHDEWKKLQKDKLLLDGKNQKLENLAKHQCFWKSGFHPDREGHKIISNWIHKTIQGIV